MGLGKGLLKMLLVLFCALFLIAGVAIVAVAIWTIADKVFLSRIIGTDLFSVASYFLLIGGIIILISSIIGLVGIIREKRLLILIFFILLVIIFLLLIIGAIMAVVFRGELEGKMINAMRDTLRTKYGNSNADAQKTTAAWDKVQKDLRCCAVTDEEWALYKETAFYKNQQFLDRNKKKLVPETCCVYDLRKLDYRDVDTCQNFGMGPPGNPTTDFTNVFLYYNGCYKASKDFLMEQSGVLIAIGFVFSLTMIGGLVLTMFYVRRITLDAEAEKRHRYTADDVAHDEKENESL